MTLKLGMILNCIRSHEIRCGNEPHDRKLLPTTKVTTRSGIRIYDLS